MLAATPDLLAAALADLDPGSRALLDLSLRRGMPDEEIAQFLGTDVQSVSERRAEVIDEITYEVGGAGPDDAAEVRAGLVDLPPEGWSGEPLPAAAPDPEPEDVPAAPPQAPPAKALRRPADSPLTPGRIAAAVIALLVVGIAIFLLALSATDDDVDPTTTTETPATGTSTEARTETGPGQPDGPLARFDSLIGEGRGTARLIDGGQRLDLRLRALPDPLGARYEIWLYDDIARARSIGSFSRESIDLDASLPANPANYEFIDVSLEPDDDNPNHSGETVLRLPTSEL